MLATDDMVLYENDTKRKELVGTSSFYISKRLIPMTNGAFKLHCCASVSFTTTLHMLPIQNPGSLNAPFMPAHDCSLTGASIELQSTSSHLRILLCGSSPENYSSNENIISVSQFNVTF